MKKLEKNEQNLVKGGTSNVSPVLSNKVIGALSHFGRVGLEEGGIDTKAYVNYLCDNGFKSIDVATSGSVS